MSYCARLFRGLALSVLIGGQSLPAYAKSAVFFHPDGMGLNTWQALRYATVGPEGLLNWDKLPYMGIYVGTMSDSAAATSNGAATIHAYGVKAGRDSYGMIDGKSIAAATDFNGSLIEEAKANGFKTALINSGNIIEPGTGAYAARAKKRSDYDTIAEQIIHSDVDIILSGGEQHLLPEGVKGRHGYGKRQDQQNLVKDAIKLGYKVVYTRSELEQAVKQAPQKLLGVFAADHSFNDRTELELKVMGMPRYQPDAPSVSEMVEAALMLLKKHDFLMVVEEEGTDNFANAGNPDAVLEAAKRADDALGVMIEYQKKIPDLMVITTSDSDAGGLQLSSSEDNKKTSYHYKTASGQPVYFNLETVGTEDYAGGILVRSNEPVPVVVDNTLIHRLIAQHLFEKKKR